MTRPSPIKLANLEAATVSQINAGEIAGDGLSNNDLDAKALDQDKLAELAALPALDYDRKREAAAKELGIRVTTLDAHVQELRRKNAPDEAKPGQGEAISLFEPEAWHETVDGAELIVDMAAAIRRYVVVTDEQALAIALWALHTHLLDCFTISPRLAITSPEPGCGKTTLLDVLNKLCWRALLAVNISASSVFRTVATYSPALLIDEADTFLANNEALRGVLNSGHRRGGKVIRTVGDDYEPKEFATYSACAISMIGTLAPTLDSRSIAITMTRAKAGEFHSRFRFDKTSELDILAKMARRWAIDNQERVKEADPETGELYNRVADNWRTVFAIADVAGADIGERARLAAKALTGGEKQTRRVELLSHIRDIFAAQPVQSDFTSKALAAALAEIDSAPWAEWSHGKPLTPKALASLLAPLGIAPASDGKRRGYSADQFTDAFERFLPSRSVNVSESPSNKDFRAVSMCQSGNGFDGSNNAKKARKTSITDTLTDRRDDLTIPEGELDPDDWAFNIG